MNAFNEIHSDFGTDRHTRKPGDAVLGNLRPASHGSRQAVAFGTISAAGAGDCDDGLSDLPVARLEQKTRATLSDPGDFAARHSATGREPPRSHATDDKTADAQADGPSIYSDIRILVVDDDDDVREVVTDMLTDFGYSVMQAASAKAAYALAHTVEGLDLVLTDVVMPVEDGTRLAARLRHDFPDLRIVFISGYRQAHSLAGEKILAKPFTAAVLGRFVAESLGRAV
jgi:CheY-like chemotaxis protein